MTTNTDTRRLATWKKLKPMRSPVPAQFSRIPRMAKKMTKARREVLQELRDDGPRTYADHWPPIKWALANGYVEQFTVGLSDLYRVTPAGHQALDEAQHDR